MEGDYLVFGSELGGWRLIEGASGLAGATIEDGQPPPTDEEWGRGSGLLDRARGQIQEYLAGTRREFDLPVDLAGTDFQRSVWDELMQIPYGKTISYKELARRIGRPEAVRAVGAAVGKNPLWVIVPCHRAVGAGGGLVGYAGGLWRKRWLLERERESLLVG